eukprot:3911211-Amphidinium_carterae.1
MSRGSGLAHWASRSGLQTAPCDLLAGCSPAQSLDKALRPATDGGSVQVWARPPPATLAILTTMLTSPQVGLILRVNDSLTKQMTEWEGCTKGHPSLWPRVRPPAKEGTGGGARRRSM